MIIHYFSYENTEEYIRRVTWESNLKYIRKHNLEADFGVHKHRLGMNEYGDLVKDRLAILNELQKLYLLMKAMNYVQF